MYILADGREHKSRVAFSIKRDAKEMQCNSWNEEGIDIQAFKHYYDSTAHKSRMKMIEKGNIYELSVYD